MLSKGDLEPFVSFAIRDSDMLRQNLGFLAESCALAHEYARGGLSVEIGTRLGGSAMLQLFVIHALYHSEDQPFLFTVDPYGGKPYQGGDVHDDNGKALYGDHEYAKMKMNLAAFPNHVHWYMESLLFLKIAPWLSYWSHSHRCYVKDFSFVLLDGEHRWETVAQEIEELIPLMNKGGVILIDNVDKDPGMEKVLSKYVQAIEPGPQTTPGNLQVRIMMGKL